MSKNNAEENSTKTTMKRKNKIKPLRSRVRFFLGTLLTVFLIGGAYYAYTWYTSPEHKIVLEERRDEKIISDLREIILLPSEKPTIYTIEDPIPLMQSQPFFAGSQEGDKLLIFTQIAKAIVYSPDREVIVNIGPVTAEPALEENVEGLQGTQNQDDSQQNVLTDEEVDNI